MASVVGLEKVLGQGLVVWEGASRKGEESEIAKAARTPEMCRAPRPTFSASAAHLQEWYDGGYCRRCETAPRPQATTHTHNTSTHSLALPAPKPTAGLPLSCARRPPPHPPRLADAKSGRRAPKKRAARAAHGLRSSRLHTTRGRHTADSRFPVAASAAPLMHNTCPQAPRAT